MLNTVYRIWFIVVAFVLVSFALKGQNDSILSKALEYKIKLKVLQDVQASKYLLLSQRADKLAKPMDRDFSTKVFFVSGFVQFFPKIAIRRSALKIPSEEGWRLFTVEFPTEAPINGDFFRWVRDVFSLYPIRYRDIALVAVTEEEKVVILSRWAKKDYSIEKYFQFRSDKPESYIPYLKIQLYRQNADNIFFRSHKLDTLLFECISTYHNGIKSKQIIKVPKDKPSKFKIETIERLSGASENYNPSIIRKYQPAPFKNYEEKKQYLQAHLMSNIYLYKLRQKIDTIPEGQDFDQLRDSLLPAYDEYLDRCLPLHYGCCWVDYEKVKALRSHLPIDTRFIKEWRDSRFQIVVGEGRPFNKHVEFYKFYVDTTLVLCKRPDPQFEGAPGYEVTGEWRNEVGGGDRSYGVGGEWRYDLFYQPERKRAFIPEIGEFFPPPPLFRREPAPWLLSGCTMGNSYDTISGHYDLPYLGIGVPVNHYLLALDTETRDVFFVSGKDIFLSEVGPLYTDMKVKWDNSKRILNFDDTSYYLLKDSDYHRYTYIQDRLYCYLVERLDRSNVIYEDEEKVVLRCKGKEYQYLKEIELEVTLYFDDPENLEIKRLN